MRKSLLFRSLTVFLAAATLLSSTSAYNLLVYANQEIESSSLSASNDETYEPNISVQGGELITESTDLVLNGEDSGEGLLSWGTDVNGNPADGSQQNPYQISSLEHLLAVDSMVNDTTGSVVVNPQNKYFVLTADIDISSLSVSNFVNSTGSAYLLSTDYRNKDSNEVYIHLDGSYVDENDVTHRHKITGGASGWNIEIAGHQNFSLFGYLSAKSVIQNVVFENINVNVTVNNFRQVAIISNKNDGLIQNCSVNNCTVSASLTTVYTDSYFINDGVYFYNGVAGAVADNAGTIENVSVNNFALTLKGEEDYIGAVAAQNRGLINNSSVSGIKVSATAKNFYIGGIAGYNEPDSTSLGVKNCQVDLAGENGISKNFTNGSYVGGLVGSNDGYLYNSSVTGTFTSSDNTTANAYNMLGNASSASEKVTYYGGAAGISTGSIVNVTVSDFGFYYASNTKTKSIYFGGITSTVKSAGSVVSCVSTGTFAAQENTDAYAGGVIAYAADDIEDGAISNTYTLFKIDNPTQKYVGAVIGAGGKASALTNCYWSDFISGCSTSYVQYDEYHSSLIAGADAVNGNLVSPNKAVIAERNKAVSVAANELTHSWANSPVTFAQPQGAVSVPTNVSNNTLTEAQYSVSVNFGTVGASDKSVMNVGMHIDALITSAVGDPDGFDSEGKWNPMQITSSNQAKFLYLVPYGHYIIKNNISVSSSVWEAPLFSGTIDGNGKTVSTDTYLFEAVIGTRGGSIGSVLDTSKYITDPSKDNEEYLKGGYITELNVDLADNITSSVFGSLINATFVNVNLTDGDEMEDDGDKSTFDGYYATFNSACQATFASSANGYSYIYGCSTNVSAYVASEQHDQALFIAKLTGETTVDNCNIHANFYITAGIEGNYGRAAFIGNIASNTGYILNSAICTRVDVSSGVSGRAYVVFGNINAGNNNGKYRNIVWSKNDPVKHLYPMNGTDYNNQLVLWGAVVASDETYTYPKKIISNGVAASFSVNIPANIKAFEDAKASDFTVTPDSGAESAFEVVSVSVDNGALKFVVRAKDDAAVSSKDNIRIYHRLSGLTTFVSLEVANAGLVYNEEDGFYHITSSSDIKFIADNYAKANSDYAGAAYILDNDIDMTGITIRPIGSSNIPFTGIFTCPVDANGAPLYTISNLTVESDGDNSALFGVVDFSGADMTLGTQGTTHALGISNISITDASVKGANNVAVLVGYAGHTDTNNKVYKNVNINNVIIRNSVVTAGVDTVTGKTAAAVIACADNANLNISGVKIENVEIKSFYNPALTTPYYFISKYEDGANYSGGIGGVVGLINETYRGYGVGSAMEVNISDVDISSLNIRGTNVNDKGTDEIFVPLNAGGVVGTYFTQYVAQSTQFAVLNIGNSSNAVEGYDINVKDIVISSKGNSGGILGATNVKATINSARVYGSASGSAYIHANTDYFVGGIAGYIGSKIKDNDRSYDNAPLDKVYGTVSGCLVDNVTVQAKLTSESQLTRNVTVGGAVGAINGNIYGNAVSDTTVQNSRIEGVVVGGIVGSSIETNSTRNNTLDNNSISIDSCSVLGSQITTVPGAVPAAETNTATGSLNYGVGGILGTNRRTLFSFAQHTTIQRCHVDENTVITNNISAQHTVAADGKTHTVIHAATGGILGSGFENGDEAGSLVIKNNKVYALIESKQVATTDTAVPDQYSAYYNAVSATGGLVGALIGRQYDYNDSDSYSPVSYELCDLSKISIMHGIFGGTILGTDGIGGAVGVIACATAYNADNPSNLLSDIAVTGELKSVMNDDTYRGGVVIGHIAIKSDGKADDDLIGYYAFDVAAGTDLTSIFDKIYFTSFGLDTNYFPVFGYHNATAGTAAVYTPFAENAKTMLINCYEDVNKKDNNKDLQFTDAESAETFPTADVASLYYPLETRPVGVSGAYSVAGQTWYSSNRTIAEVKSSGPNDLTIEPLNSGTISVMINYVGTVGDGTWSAEAYLPAGFRFKSNNQNPLDYVTVDGVNYYLITTPNDFAILGKNMEEGSSNQGSFDAAYMALNYWITNDIDFPKEMFTTDGFYDGGFITIGSTSVPFTGSLSSMPSGTYTSNGNGAEPKQFTSDGYHTISGMKLKSDGTHMGLFAAVSGATFENFAIDGFTAQGTESTTYLGTLAAVVSNNVTVNNINLSNINLTGADYTGGFFGGTINGASASEFTNVSLTGNTGDDTYSNIIGANYGAAGIIAHTSQYNTNITNVTVQDAQITQESTDADNAYFDYGAAGVAMAYSGAISVTDSFRNKIDHCSITGEVAGGVVMRSYTSTSATAFVNKASDTVNSTNPAQRADKVEINAFDIVASSIEGTHVVSTTTSLAMTLRKTAASAGILARVDTAYKQHNITNCVVDSDTYVSALVAASGIVGCIESVGSNSSTYSVIPYYLTVDGCESYATVEMTEPTRIEIKNAVGSSTSLYNSGAGAVLACLGRYHSNINIRIKNTIAGGVIRGNGAIGGIIGASWSENTYSDLNTADGHLVENCVVSATLETPNGDGTYAHAFSAERKGAGIIVGNLSKAYTTAASTTIYNFTYSENNYPFYNIFISDVNYSAYNYVYLYGTNLYSNKLHSITGTTYGDTYTKYIYNLNRTGSFTIDTTSHVLTFSSNDNRIFRDGEGVPTTEKYLYKLNYSYIKGGEFVFSTDIFSFDSTVNDADKNKYLFEQGASVNGFTVSANTAAGAVTAENAVSTEFVLESITSSDKRIRFEATDSTNTSFRVISEVLSGGVSGKMYFNYSNGLTLAIDLEIEIKPEDYWFKDETADGNPTVNLLIFNAANLSFVKSKATANSVITQCYDVYWTVSDQAVINAANAAVGETTLAQVYPDEFLTALSQYKHPNPFYDGTSATKEYVTFDEMFSTSDNAARGAVLLKELVGEIGTTAFSVYGEKTGASIYSGEDPFVGTYTVNTASVASGLTAAGETYKIYGLELQANITSVNDYPSTGSAYTGMFNRIGAGAQISGITFVNPVVNAFVESAADNYVGVLAGDIAGEGTAITNISVIGTKGKSYVANTRNNVAANSYTGVIAGSIGAGVTVDGATVSGIDVIGASIASNNTSVEKNIKRVYVGGVAGSSAGTLKNVTVDADILVNRYQANGYIAYAGGIAGKASGSVEKAAVSALVSGCDVESNKETVEGTERGYITSYTPNPTADVGDRLGGVTGLVDGSITIKDINLSRITVNAYDIAGGVVAEIANDANITVQISGCDIGSDSHKASVTVTGASNPTAKTGARWLYNLAGGMVGLVENLASLQITDCDFNGYIGQYEISQRECTSGGVIALVGESFTSFDKLTVNGSTVQGEIQGYRRQSTHESANARMYGAAGGIIGKIYNYAEKTNSNDVMISDCIMSARVDLYLNINRTAKADYDSLENRADTNVGKIIGELLSGPDNFAFKASANDESKVCFTNYVSNVYVSSYPQNIVAYGSSAFYSNTQNDPKDTYTDINKEQRYTSAEDTDRSSVSSFMVDGTIADPSVTPDNYNTGSYSDVAIITFDKAAQGTNASRYFRLAYDKMNVYSGKTIDFSGVFAISVEDDSADLSGVSVTAPVYSGNQLLTETVKGEEYKYYPGVITLESDENIDIVGYISAKYSYGLEAGIQFVSMEIAGNGSQAKPFEIAEPKHFKVVRALRSAYYKQVNNIDFASAANNQYDASNPDALFAKGKGIEPIGTVSAPFTGEYNGNGFILSNVYIARPGENNVGFFGYIGTGNDTATLKNIHIELASKLDIADENSQITTVSGGITGGEAVGGLVGYANNALITNCSVANGFVVGKTKVGGLVGCTGQAEFDSCFTSTSTYSSITAYADGAAKNVGALVGYTANTTDIRNSFTLGLASVGTTSDMGVAGGMVGYADASLYISNALVGATVSNYTSIQDGDLKFIGLTVGQASSMANVTAGNVTVSATVTFSKDSNTKVSPVVGGASGATVSNIRLDSSVIGDLNLPYYSGVDDDRKESYTLLGSDITAYDFSTGSAAAGDDYTAAYVAIAVIPVDVENDKATENLNTYTEAGLFYPVSLNHAGEYTFTSSVIEETDIEYPENLDADLYGNVTASGNNKNTDLLFKDVDGTTIVYPNSYPVKYDMTSTDPKVINSRKAVLTDGSVYSNGEIAYDTSLPYFTVSKTVNIGGTELEIARKVVYPRQIRTGVYPIATARQLFALTNAQENDKDSKYYDSYTVSGGNSSLTRNYIVVADIDLGKNNFTPVSGYRGELNGNGYTVDNLVILMPGQNEVGLFTTLGSGKITDLTLGIYHIQGKDNVGGLVGAVFNGANEEATVTIKNCHTVLSEGGIGIDASGRNVGGLIGAALSNSNAIDGSSSSVTVKGTDIVGGLIGYCETSVTNSYSTGAVNASFTASNAATSVRKLNAGGSVADTVVVSNQNNTGTTGGQHGIGGLVGVLANSTRNGALSRALVQFSFSSGIVTVENASYLANGVYGAGGLVGIDYGAIVDGVLPGAQPKNQAVILTSFSSGNVYYCYGNEALSSLANVTLGVGGLVGVICETLNDVYSSASVAADLGGVEGAKAVGVGGVVGIAYDTLTSAYSSGSTLSTTTTDEEVYAGCNYGKGGVIGLLDSYPASEGKCANLRFDLNLSILKDEVGKIVSGEIEGYEDGVRQENCSSGPATTKQFTNGTVKMSENFGYTEGAYPYLKDFFKNSVSQTVRINALLSIVALQLNPLDTSAANGNGISMALDIPIGVTYDATGGDDSANAGVYAYGYADNNNLVDAAQGVIDESSHTISIQRTVNEAQYVNFVVTIESKDGSLTAEDGTVYSEVANRVISRLCAPMLGTYTHPYLVATQADLEHVGMTNSELNDPVYTYGMYKQWATPITENGTPKEGKVHFRLMGYVSLEETGEGAYNRVIPDLTNEAYSFGDSTINHQGISFNGNGYSIRNLSNRLFERIDNNSELSNMTFQNVSFNSTSLIGTVEGKVTGVNVFGTASGSNTAAIANTVADGGTITGAVADVDYSVSGSVINVAGIAVENNGTISMSASVGNFTGGLFTNIGALAAVNNGVINNSFTIGNIRAEDADNLGGFVNKNTGSIINCYTRCNIIVSGNQGDEVVASFAAHNSGSITNAYSSGLLSFANAVKLYSVFVADNTAPENLKNCMFDKQMSGQQFKNIYKLAERTNDIINLTFHNDMITVNNGDDNRIAYKVIEDTTANNPYDNVYYPQLSAILNTAVVSEDASEEEVIRSSMYSVLRAYSFISSATALVGNDNYIDNLGYSSATTLSYDSVNNNMWTETSGSGAASVGTYNEDGNNVGKYISASEQQNIGENTGAVFTASYAITDFYGLEIKVLDNVIKAQLDLFVNVTDGTHPNFAGGNGSADNRFEISTAEQFMALSFYGTNPDNNFIIKNDIDMMDAEWETYIETFKADLDGNGMAVSNITIGEGGNDSLFGKIDGGKIANLGIAGIDVTVTGSEGGMLASTATGGASITNTYVVGTLTADSDKTANVGGLVGNADNATIDGCVVSGKLDSAASVTGGVVGSALDGSAIRNVLSTVYVNGAADGTAAGVAGTVSSGVELKNCVFASDVKGGTAGNIVGDGRAVETCFYDKQMSSVTDEANGVSTHYLTSGATMQQLGFVDEQSEPAMTRIDGFNGYPVPVGMVSGSELFLAGLKFASAKINLASGVGAGTLNTFTSVTAEPSLGGGVTAELNFGADGENVTNYYLVKPDGTTAQINTDTNLLALGDSAQRYITYTTSNVFDSDKMLRYLDVNVGKALTVRYNYVGLDSEEVILTVYSGMNNVSAVTAFGADTNGETNQLLSSSMIIPKDAQQNAYILRAASELPQGKQIGSVDLAVYNNGTAQNVTVNTEKLTDGTWKLAIETESPVECDEIVITVNVADADIWGVHQYFNLF